MLFGEGVGPLLPFYSLETKLSFILPFMIYDDESYDAQSYLAKNIYNSY